MSMSESLYSFSEALTPAEVKAYHALLRETYWAGDRALRDVESSLGSSIVVAVRHRDDGLVGCARAVTDKATFTWICDVVVDPMHRGRGLGKELIRRLLAHPDIEPTRKVLVTKDAQELYRELGFETHRYECMILYPQKPSADV
jgi:N-acetylglutamate synthase-like GNAT family acetyltransferase